MREREEIEDRDRAGRRLGAIVVLLQAQEHRVVLPCRAEPSALDWIPEQRVLAVLQRLRPFEPPRIAVGLKQLEQTEDEIRVVLGVAVDTGFSLAVSPQQDTARRACPERSRRVTQLRVHELRGSPGIVEESGSTVEDPGGARERG